MWNKIFGWEPDKFSLTYPPTLVILIFITWLIQALLLEIHVPVKLPSSQLVSQECKMKFPPERRDIVGSFYV